MTTTTWDTSRKQNVTLSGSNLIATASSSNACVIAADPQSSGKWYFECTANTIVNSNTCVGLAVGMVNVATFESTALNATIVNKSGLIFTNNVSTGSNIGALSNGSLVCVAVDISNRLIWMRLGAAGNWNGSGTANPATGTGGLSISALGSGGAYEFYPLAGFNVTNDQWTANFGASSFTGTVPSGFTSGWNTGTIATNLVTTQAGAQIWSTPNPALRVTQAGAQIWGTTTGIQARITQAGAEAWVNPSAPIRITQAGAEAWTTPNPSARVTQAGAIFWVDIRTILLSRQTLTLTPQGFTVNRGQLFALDQASLTLTPQAFTVNQQRKVTLDQATLTLTPQAFSVPTVIAIAQTTLTLTPQTFQVAIVLVVNLAQQTLTLTPQTFTWSVHTRGTEVDFDTASLTLGPVAFGIVYVTPFLHMTQEPMNVAATKDTYLRQTEQSVAAAVSTGTSDLRQTETSVEAAVVSTTSWLRQTQTSLTAATSVVNVPLRVSQFAVEVLRGFPETQGWNTSQIVVPVYPVIPGLGFNVKRTLAMQNVIQPHVSGKETRVGGWSQSIYQYELTYELLRDWPTFDEYRLMEQFWLQCMGQQGVFLFDDPDDDVVTGQLLGVGNGKETQYQCVRSFGKTGDPLWNDTIQAPRVMSAVYCDGHLLDPTRWDLTYWDSNIPGVLSIHDAVPVGVNLTADFSYYWPCHFTEDTASFEQFLHQFWELKSVKFETVKCNNILLLPHPENFSNATTTPILP